MSFKKNKELLIKLYEYFDAGEVDKVMSHIHEDADWAILGDKADIPISGQAKGHEEILELFKQCLRIWILMRILLPITLVTRMKLQHLEI